MNTEPKDKNKIKSYLTTFYNAVYKHSIEDYYKIFDKFNKLNKEEKDSAILNIIFYKYIKENNNL